MKIIKNGWDFFQDQILGMHWLKDLIGKLLVKAGLGEGRFPGEFLHFFLYDIIKIFVLLAVLIFVISYIQSYFPPERSRKIMGRFHGIWANLIGALLGTVTPFCSCSSIPIFMGFTSAGLPLGVTFSFLFSKNASEDMLWDQIVDSCPDDDSDNDIRSYLFDGSHTLIFCIIHTVCYCKRR